MQLKQTGSDSEYDTEVEWPLDENPPGPGVRRITPAEPDIPLGPEWEARPVPTTVSVHH